MNQVDLVDEEPEADEDEHDCYEHLVRTDIITLSECTVCGALIDGLER